ncbi:alpha/beta hydrolase [Xanthobacter versatilis]|uniref:alpha/beta hydrolase n=1 Tax=Xanthobacter autotrophicus (strain ATCC BAA-1158 / Py2) TaxID=78245 RepID=UPI00372C1D1F
MPVDRSIMIEGGPIGVLLIHGLGGTPVELREVARRLAATGATVLCCQLAGHCGTEEELAATRFEDWYASAEAALAALEARCTKVVVGGLSMGALLAALLAARNPDSVDGVVMLAPTLRYDGWSIPRYGFLLRLLINTPLGRRYRFVEREPYGLKDERIRTMILRAMRRGDTDAGSLGTPSAALKQLWRLVARLKPLLGSIRQPVFIAHARHDDVASFNNAVLLQRRLGGTVECLVLDDSYHLVTLDRQRHLVTDRVAAFIRGVVAAPNRHPVLEPRRAAAARAERNAPIAAAEVAHVA